MIGVCGGVGSSVALGVVALSKGLAHPVGLVTQLPPLADAHLIEPGAIVIGGHEIRTESLLEAVRSSHREAGLFDRDLIDACATGLRAFQRNVRTGALGSATKTVRALFDRGDPATDACPAAAVERLSADIVAFKRRHKLRHVVVIHVASSEPGTPRSPAHESFAKLSKTLTRSGSRVVPTSSIYALAAIEAGCAYVNFTPSMGIRMPALRKRAKEVGIAYMGDDGKTGESLVKSFLAPMFSMRNLNVLSWVGQNILGNRDGAVLNDAKTRASKIRSKDRILSHLTDPNATAKVSIDYVPSLSDWKVAWDYIHFEGFLGTKMDLQFTWRGSDSALAAPLVIDLTRLAEREARDQRAGPMQHLACFFKDPIGVDQTSYFAQWQLLVDHFAKTAGSR